MWHQSFSHRLRHFSLGSRHSSSSLSFSSWISPSDVSRISPSGHASDSSSFRISPSQISDLVIVACLGSRHPLKYLLLSQVRGALKNLLSSQVRRAHQKPPCRLSKNHWRQVVKYRAHTSDVRLIKIICSVKTRGSKSSLQSQVAGLKARVLASLQSKTSQHHCKAKTRGSKLVSPQSSTLASQYHSNAKMQGSRLASNIISMAKRRAQARVSTANEPYISVITTPLLGQVRPT